MSKHTIVVCDHIHDAGLQILQNTEDINYVYAADVNKTELLDIIKDAHVAITRSSTDVDEKFLNAAINLKAKSISVATPILPTASIPTIESIADDLYFIKKLDHFVEIDFYYDSLDDVSFEDLEKIIKG